MGSRQNLIRARRIGCLRQMGLHVVDSDQGAFESPGQGLGCADPAQQAADQPGAVAYGDAEPRQRRQAQPGQQKSSTAT